MGLLTDICLWEDVIFLPNFEEQIEAARKFNITREKIDSVILKMLNGELSRGLNFEQLYNYPVYSCALGKASRLISVTITRHEKKYLVPLEIIPTHDYHKGQFQSDSILIDYLKHHCGLSVKRRNQRDYQIETTEDTPISLENYFKVGMQPIQDKSPTTTPRRKSITDINPKKAIYYNSACLNLTDMQGDVSTKIEHNNRGVIIGPPGSGKSLLAFKILKAQYTTLQKILAKNNDDPDDDPVAVLPILYCCESAALCDQMQKNWIMNYGASLAIDETIAAPLMSASPLAKPLVLFMTYRQVLIEFCGIREEQLVDQQKFIDWYPEYYKTQKTLKKTIGHQDFDILSTFKSPYQIYKALRRYSKEFTETGVRSGEAEATRKYNALCRLYEYYMTFLAAHACIDPAFYILPPDIAIRLSFGHIDEAQDLTIVQIENISKLVFQSQATHFLDTHQSMIDAYTKLKAIVQLLRHTGNHIALIEQLTESHRCSTEIIEYLNRLLQLRHRLFEPDEKNQQTHLIPAANSPKGSVKMISTSAFKTLVTENPTLSGSTDVAVILKDEEDLQELGEHEIYKNFHQKITPIGAKGLEYQVVIAHDLLGFLFKLENILDRHDPHTNESLRYESKAWSEDEVNEIITLIYTIYVIFSRAKEHLIIVETDENFKRLQANQKLLSWVTPVQAKGSQAAPAEEIILQVSDKTSWEQRMQRYIELKEWRMASDIFQKQLGLGNQADFDAYILNYKQPGKGPEVSLRKVTSESATTPVLFDAPEVEKQETASKATSRPKTNTQSKHKLKATLAAPPKALLSSSTPAQPAQKCLVQMMDKFTSQLQSISANNIHERLLHDENSIFKLINDATMDNYDLLLNRVQEWLNMFCMLSASRVLALLTHNDLLNQLSEYTKKYPRTTRLYHMILVTCIKYLKIQFTELKKYIPDFKENISNQTTFSHFITEMKKKADHAENSIWNYLLDNYHIFAEIIQLTLVENVEIHPSNWFIGFQKKSGFRNETPLFALSKIFGIWEINFQSRNPKIPKNRNFEPALNAFLKLIDQLDLPDAITEFGITVASGTQLQKILRIIHPDHAHSEVGFAILRRLYDLEIRPLATGTQHRTFWTVQLPKALELAPTRGEFYYHFLNSTEGLTILSGLLMFSEKVSKKIIYHRDFFTRHILLIVGKYVEFCPFYSLSTSAAGIIVLNQLIEEPKNASRPRYIDLFDRYSELIKGMICQKGNPTKLFLFNLIDDAFNHRGQFNREREANILFAIELITKKGSLLRGLDSTAWVNTSTPSPTYSIFGWSKLLSDLRQENLLQLFSLLMDLNGENDFIPQDQFESVLYTLLHSGVAIDKNMQAILIKLLARYHLAERIFEEIIEDIDGRKSFIQLLFIFLQAQNTTTRLLISDGRGKEHFKTLTKPECQSLLSLIDTQPELKRHPVIAPIIDEFYNKFPDLQCLQLAPSDTSISDLLITRRINKPFDSGCSIDPPAPTHQEDADSFYKLTQSEQGINFLSEMLSIKPELVEHLFLNIPQHICIVSDPVSTHSLLYPLLQHGLNNPDHENLVHFIISCIEKHSSLIRFLGIFAWLPPTPALSHSNVSIGAELLALIFHSNPLGLELCTALVKHCPDLINTFVLDTLLTELLTVQDDSSNSNLAEFITQLSTISFDRYPLIKQKTLRLADEPNPQVTAENPTSDSLSWDPRVFAPRMHGVARKLPAQQQKQEQEQEQEPVKYQQLTTL